MLSWSGIFVLAMTQTTNASLIFFNTYLKTLILLMYQFKNSFSVKFKNIMTALKKSLSLDLFIFLVR